MVAEVQRDLSSYRLKPGDEITSAISAIIRGVVSGLAQERVPGPDEQRHSYEVGRRHAELGATVVEMTAAYHVGFAGSGRRCSSKGEKSTLPVRPSS